MSRREDVRAKRRGRAGGGGGAMQAAHRTPLKLTPFTIENGNIIEMMHACDSTDLAAAAVCVVAVCDM